MKSVTYEEAKIDLNHATWKQEVAMSTQDLPSLYERLGGVYSIATVVDDLIDRVMADPRLNANPLVDEAHHKVPPAGGFGSHPHLHRCRRSVSAQMGLTR